VTGCEHPGAALGAVEAALRSRGLAHIYGAACARYGVLSVTGGLTVWTDGRTLAWQHEGQPVTWPAADPSGAAARLADLVRPDRPPRPPERF
jgi:hypothetical protein